MSNRLLFTILNKCAHIVLTLRSCVTSALSSLVERSMVRDSLLPDSPRVKTDPDKHSITGFIEPFCSSAECVKGVRCVVVLLCTCGFDVAAGRGAEQETVRSLGLTGGRGRLRGGWII